MGASGNGNKTVVYLGNQLPESQKEKKILLLKLDTFITGYGHFYCQRLEPFDESLSLNVHDLLEVTNMIKNLIVYAHPYEKSFNHAILEQVWR